jgi:hypothetical protein
MQSNAFAVESEKSCPLWAYRVGVMPKIPKPSPLKAIRAKCLDCVEGPSDVKLNIVETLIYVEELGNKPETVVIGIEPGDWTSWSTELTEPVRNRMEDIIAVVLREIEKAGGSWKKNDRAAKTRRVV